MKILEKKIEAAAVKWAKDRGIMVSKLNGFGSRSMPDRVFWFPGGTPLFIEFKRPDGETTVLQKYTHERLGRAGYHVAVINSKEAAVALLDYWLGQTRHG